MNISANNNTFVPRALDRGAVNPALLAEVKNELGADTALVSGLQDDRVDFLKGQIIDGLEGVWQDPAKVLGAGWRAMDTDNNSSTDEYQLGAKAGGDSQEIVFNTDSRSVTLSTRNSFEGPYDSTVEFEEIEWRTSDDHVKRFHATGL